MATSQSLDLTYDVMDMIEQAMELAGIDVQKAGPRHLKTARIALNIMLTRWSNRDIKLWAIDSYSQVVTQGDSDITLPVGTIDVLDLVLRRSGSDTPMVPISRSDYLAIPNKATQGRPDRYWVNRQNPTPILNIYQAPENSTDTLVGYVFRHLYDVDSYTEEPDVPRRFWAALTTGLALELHKRKPQEQRNQDWFNQLTVLRADAVDTLDEAESEDRDRSGIGVYPGTWYSEVR